MLPWQPIKASEAVTTGNRLTEVYKLFKGGKCLRGAWFYDVAFSRKTLETAALGVFCSKKYEKNFRAEQTGGSLC